MALSPDILALISDVHHFLTDILSQEVLSEDSEDKRGDLSGRLCLYLHPSNSTKSLPRLQTATINDPIMRVKTNSNPGLSPELPRAPPPGQVRKVCPKDLKGSTIYEGLIEKLGGKNQEKWQKRYCILTSTHLYFFENNKSKKQNNQIYIPAFSITPVKEKGDERHFSFRLSSSKDSKNYYFRVNDRETFSHWLQNITQLSVGPNTLGVSDFVSPRAETMVFNQDDVISTASSSDEGPDNTLETIREDSPPPIPPPTSRLPKSPQAIRKISSSPVPPIQPPPSAQPPPVLAHPPPVNTQPPPVNTQPPPIVTVSAVNNTSTPPSTEKASLEKPPPPPTRRSTALTSGPGVSVEKLRKIKLSQSDSGSSIPEDSEAVEVLVDTDRVYETSEEEDFPYDKIYVGKWDFRGEEGDELTFKRGELLLVADPDESSKWWIGDLLDTETLKACDRSGLFHSAYVEAAFLRL